MARLLEMWRDLSTLGKIALCVFPFFLAFIVYARIYWYETETYSEDVGLNGEAATNPFFGFEVLAKNNLDASGGSFTKLETSVNVADYPPEKSLLMLSAWRLSRMTPLRVKQIKAWVERGGTLVLEAEPLAQEDPLLKAFGMERWRVAFRKGGYVELAPKKSPAGMDGAADDDDDAVPPKIIAKQIEKVMGLMTGAVKFKWDDGEYYSVKLGEPVTLKLLKPEDTDFSVRGNVGNSILKRQFGKGQVVALVSFAFMRRAAILKDDAGLFAMRLLEPNARPKPLVPLRQIAAEAAAASGLIAKDNSTNTSDTATLAPLLDVKLPANPSVIVLGLHMEPKSLLQWLTKHGMPVVLAAVALLLFWLWSIIPRFGPIAAPQVEVRRNIADHWRAAGQYLLGRRNWKGLLHAPRTRILRRLRSRLGMVIGAHHAANATVSVDSLSTEQLARLEQICKVSAGRIHSALHAEPSTPSQLLTFMVTLRQLEVSLK